MRGWGPRVCVRVRGNHCVRGDLRPGLSRLWAWHKLGQTSPGSLGPESRLLLAACIPLRLPEPPSCRRLHPLPSGSPGAPRPPLSPHGSHGSPQRPHVPHTAPLLPQPLEATSAFLLCAPGAQGRGPSAAVVGGWRDWGRVRRAGAVGGHSGGRAILSPRALLGPDPGNQGTRLGLLLHVLARWEQRRARGPWGTGQNQEGNSQDSSSWGCPPPRSRL